MQGRAAAVYGLVFLLVAAGAFTYATVAEPPEPTMDNPDQSAAQGEMVTLGDREYEVTGFGSQRGQPTAKLVWTDEEARSSEEWTHAAEPGGTTVTYENSSYWVRIPQTASTNSFTLLETPGEDSNVSVFTDGDGNWIVNDGGNYVDLENYDAFERVDVENGSMLTTGSGNESRDVRVDSVTNDSVSVSWSDPAEVERIARQTSRSNINGQNLTVHIPGDGTVDIATSVSGIDAYLEQHEDKNDFETRMDGLTLASVISLVSFIVLIGMAFLPRKE
ncbi:hypothetical protein [Salinarchaeum laminariae]|uniref:hypothetical protein n=1 Tax=Salinarchaeum laminariae TaxID=869888 RepID=UPI0020BDF853|nr:hypothetical protein [Salinarchaeum laminariae]